MKRIRKIFSQFLMGVITLNILWWIGSLVISKDVLVSPWIVYGASLKFFLDSSIWIHLVASLYRLLIGILVAFALGISIALGIFYYKKLGKILNGLVYLAYPIPKIALLPIVMLIAGLGDSGKVIMVVLILLFQVVVNIRDSLFNIPKESFIIATSLGTSPFKIAYNILFPAILPSIFSSLRVAIGIAISVLFVAETYGTEKGMGYFIIDAWMRLNYIDMYGGIIILSVIGFILFISIDIMECICCPWQKTITPAQNNL